MRWLLLTLVLAGCMSTPKQFTPTTEPGAQCKHRCTISSPPDSFGRNAAYNQCVDSCADLERVKR